MSNDISDKKVKAKIKEIYDKKSFDNAFPGIVINEQIKSKVNTINKCDTGIAMSFGIACLPLLIAIIGIILALSVSFAAASLTLAATLWPVTLIGALLGSGLLIYRSQTKTSLKTLLSPKNDQMQINTRINERKSTGLDTKKVQRENADTLSNPKDNTHIKDPKTLRKRK